MIHFDVTKSAAAGQRSGLTRMNARLGAELGPAAERVRWGSWNCAAGPSDWFFTTELFSEAERPGFSEFLRNRRCRCAAVFHDAIPIRHPAITWPQSVARHPGYMKLLASFDRVFTVSSATREDLLGYWRWIGIGKPPPVVVLPPGADFDGQPRRGPGGPAGRPSLVCVGILEPRKNQGFLLDVCEVLWAEGLGFDLDIVGRVNPHFGKPVAARIRAMRRRGRPVRHHPSPGDGELARLYAGCRASVFPTIAEGCGFPVLESLWMGVPCVCSDLPSLLENAAEGGCLAVPVNDRDAWAEALRRVLSDDAFRAGLAARAGARPLARWADTAAALLRSLAA